jgi:hypothetical protein
VCRDEEFEGEPVVRIWTWESDPDLEVGDRLRALMQVYVDCAEDALERGRRRSTLYKREGAVQASFALRLLGDAPVAGPVFGTITFVSDLEKALERGRRFLGGDDKG